MSTSLLLETLDDLVDFLDGQKIDYALIGGLAVAVRGEPRSTLDVDVCLDCDIDRALLKQRAARPRDLDDIKSILIRQGEDFDWELALRLARELGEAVDDDLYTPLADLRSL